MRRRRLAHAMGMTIIHSSPLPDVEIPRGTITDLVFARADELGDRIAMIEGVSGEEWSFARLFEAVKRLAGGLSARGFGTGSTLAIMAPNMPEYAVAFHGAVRAGGTVTTVNPTYTPDEIRHQLIDSGASMIVTLPAAMELAAAAIVDTPVNEIVVFGEAEGATSLESLYGDPIDQVALDPAEHIAVLPYSSGTTGLPKGVMLTHRNLVANIAQMDHVLTYGEHELALAALPFFHIYGMQVLMNGLLANDVTVVSVPRFDLVQALTLIETHHITQFFVVPPMVLALAKHPVIDEHDLSSLNLVFSGAAPLGAELAREASERVGCDVVQGYGMTELSPVSHATPRGGFRPGSSGLTVSNTECRIVDEEGVDQPVDGVGELWIRGPQVMKSISTTQKKPATRSTQTVGYTPATLRSSMRRGTATSSIGSRN